MTERTRLRDVLIFCATQKSKAEDTLLQKSIDKLDIDCDIVFVLENTESLPIVYNKALKYAKEENYDCVIFIHDDVELEHDPIQKLESLFIEYDIVGVAGCSQATFNEPALWHLMGVGFNSGNLHGAVAHKSNDTQKTITGFGPYPAKVLMIDGVFMAIKYDSFEKVVFDEQNPAKFHFYDLDFSLNASINGLRVGVGDIYINHASPGLRSYTPEWLAGQKYFLEKYNKFAGSTLTL